MTTVIIIGIVGLCIVALHYAFGFHYYYISEKQSYHSKEEWWYKRCMVAGACWNFALFVFTFMSFILLDHANDVTVSQGIICFLLVICEIFAIVVGWGFWAIGRIALGFLEVFSDAFTILFSKGQYEKC
jgi:uncharacterized membrane-anchored protein